MRGGVAPPLQHATCFLVRPRALARREFVCTHALPVVHAHISKLSRVCLTRGRSAQLVDDLLQTRLRGADGVLEYVDLLLRVVIVGGGRRDDGLVGRHDGIELVQDEAGGGLVLEAADHGEALELFLQGALVVERGVESARRMLHRLNRLEHRIEVVRDHGNDRLLQLLRVPLRPSVGPHVRNRRHQPPPERQ